MRSRAQIVVSVGPTTSSVENIGDMISAGMDVARVNFSHGTGEQNARFFDNVRIAARARGVRVPVIQDLAGPRAQTGSSHHFNANEDIITEADRAHLQLGIEREVEYVAQSFVGSAEDVRSMRALIGDHPVRVIAKIERAEAVRNFDHILAEADAIMIARGDLGEAVPMEDIPFLEKMMIEKAKAAQKPVITATQMLYSMTKSPVPTRAEVTDVAYAIVLGSDAVMLSDETAHGQYPLKAVAMMERIVTRAEQEQVPSPVHEL